MLSVPTTDHAITGIIDDLDAVVLPALRDEPARLAVQMMQQILRGAAVRAAHEIAWMHEEIAEISAASNRLVDDPAVAEARRALDGQAATSLHLADMQARYALASDVLSCSIEAAYAAGDASAIAELHAVLQRRSDHEMQIVGQLDLVGRG